MAAKGIKLLEGAVAIEKAIASINTRGKKLDESIQIAGLSIIQHVEKHGDTTLADKLFDAMPKGARRGMLAEWFMAFGLMRALDKGNAEEAKALKAGRHFKIDRTRSTDLEGAQAKPWFEMKKAESAAQAFDAQKAVQSVLARLSAAAKDGRTVENREAAIRELDALRAALVGESEHAE